MTLDVPPDIAAPLEQKTEPIAPALGNLAASGFKWTLLFSFFTRILSFASSIILARLLLREEYGAYTQAFITISIVSALRDAALGTVLIARPKEFDRLQSDGFWFSLALGVVGASIIAVAGLLAWQRHDITVARLLWMNAVASPLMVLGTIPSTKIQIQLRFALNAKIATVNYLATTGLTILLAANHWGAYALMVPQVLLGIARSAYFWWLEPPKVHCRVDLINIRMLVIASGIIAYTSLSIQVIGQGDNFVVARFFGKDTVGLYGWAFNLSVQAIILLAASLGTIILSTLARLNDEPQRQIAGFLRMSRTMAVIGVPFCALQVLFAQPIVKPLFSAEWRGAESIIRILSIGMAFAMVNGFCTQLMWARKQRRLLVIWSTACMAAFIVLVYSGVRVGGVHGVAWAVVLYHSIVGTIGMRLAVGKYAHFSDILSIFFSPLLAAAAAAVPTLLMALLMPITYRGDAPLPLTLAAIAVFATLFVAVYALLIRSLSPDIWRDVLQRLDSMTRRIGVKLI